MKFMIENNGEIQNGALTLLGASTKEGDDTKIGFFGSGAKYAIAVLMRKNIPFSVYSGTKKIAFSIVKTELNNIEFDQIYIDDLPTSFTTRMGPSWETWFAIRELICNAIDEGGYRYLQVEDSEESGIEGMTRIFVDVTEEVEEFIYNIERYITDEEPIDSVDTEYGNVKILQSMSNEFIAYRKGVRCVQENAEQKSKFRYDMNSIEINESRICADDYKMRVAVVSALTKARDRNVVETVLKALTESEDTFEKNLYWRSSCASFSDAWRESLEGRIIFPEDIVKYLTPEDLYDGIVLPTPLVERLKEQFSDKLTFYDTQNATIEVIDEPTFKESQMLNNALKGVRLFGYYDESYKVQIVVFKAERVLASCDNVERIIRLSRELFEGDYDELVCALIEEYSHSYGHHDGTRDFESYLIKELLQAKRAQMKLENLANIIKEII